VYGSDNADGENQMPGETKKPIYFTKSLAMVWLT